MIRHESEMKVEVREKMRGGEGSVTIRHLFDREEFTANARLCARLIIPPGAGIGPHRHDGEDEVYVVLKGEGVLDDGKGPTRISAGDAILTGSGGSHAVKNDGSVPLELIAVILCYKPR